MCSVPNAISYSVSVYERVVYLSTNRLDRNIFKRAVFALQMDIPQYDIEYAGLLEEMSQDLFDNDTPANGLNDSDGDDDENGKVVTVKSNRQISGASFLSA